MIYVLKGTFLLYIVDRTRVGNKIQQASVMVKVTYNYGLDQNSSSVGGG